MIFKTRPVEVEVYRGSRGQWIVTLPGEDFSREYSTEEFLRIYVPKDTDAWDEIKKALKEETKP